MKTIEIPSGVEILKEIKRISPSAQNPEAIANYCIKIRNAAITLKEIETDSDFGRIHWQAKPLPTRPNYPTKTPEQLRIEDLERENYAALEKIVALSNALFELGFDPTQLP